jgi:hypothetical protein
LRWAAVNLFVDSATSNRSHRGKNAACGGRVNRVKNPVFEEPRPGLLAAGRLHFRAHDTQGHSLVSFQGCAGTGCYGEIVLASVQ